MSLEKIVDIAYKATLPIKIADKAIKLAHDVIADASGIDGFKLARYAAIGAGLSSLASSPGWFMLGNGEGATVMGFTTAISGTLSLIYSYKAIPWIETYLKKPKDILGKSQEHFLAAVRFSRIALLSQAIVLSSAVISDEVFELHSGWGTATRVLTIAGLIGLSSSLYFINTDHTLFDKAKDKVKQAYNALYNLMPRPAPLPQPRQPGYNSQTA